jgi:putative peptide zinc metalloprotease protein
MLCPNCRRQTARGSPYCPSCGAALNGAPNLFELVLRDRSRVPLLDVITIGRAAGNTLQLDDSTVSRHHARLSPGVLPLLEDIGSSHGTWVDGQRLDHPRRLRDGSRIRLGDAELFVERRRESVEAARTLVVPPGDSLLVSAVGEPRLTGGAAGPTEHPRLRSGYALKRLEAGEGPRRWVLEDLRNGKFVRLSGEDAVILQLLDGNRSVDELARESERALGVTGPARLARLLAELRDRGRLSGQELEPAGALAPAGGPLSRLLRPRQQTWDGAAVLFERLYRRGGWLFFTRPVALLLALLAVVGVFAFGFLVIARYGTPFLVGRKIGLGGLVFLLGRFAVVAFHETAHGLALASFGRRVRTAGLKLLLVFPYAYVDTSEAWFEPRRRRIVVSAAGPISDSVLGAVFSICCLTLPPGTVRDIFFQLAFAAYLGALFNLNPLLERDGYHILVDVLREPALRRRAREHLRASLSGRVAFSSSRVLRGYALSVLAWSAVAAVFAALMSARYEQPLAQIVPTPIAWAMLGGLWIALLGPIAAMIWPGLRERFRRGPV